MLIGSSDIQKILYFPGQKDKNMTYTKHDTILQVEDLSMTLDGKLILRDVNFKIEDVQVPGETRGQIESIIGPSGVGKTTLINALCGWYNPNQNTGDCELNIWDKFQKRLNPKKEIIKKETFKMEGKCLIGSPLAPVKLGQVGLVQQNYTLFEDLTVMQNLSFINPKYTKADGLQKSKEYLGYFDLWDKRDSFPYQLSGGQRQRVAILQALLSSNHYILLDEPFSGLDINMIERTIETIRKAADLDELNTFIIITHDISSACAISDEVMVLGKERNPDGTFIPGGTILKEYDLIADGLAWHNDIRKMPEFARLTAEMRDLFRTLC